MRRFSWIPAAAAAVALTASGCGSGDAETQYYLSLGDGLAVGVQPDESGEPVETEQGYTDVVFSSLSDDPPGVEHVKLGCAGENTATFVNGGAEGCEYEEGSQLAAAEAFLEENRDRVRLVTVNIGGNNLFSCARGEDGELTTAIDRECVAQNLEQVAQDAPVIAQRLRAAAGEDVEIVGVTSYNPLLAMYLAEEVTSAVAAEDDDDRTYQDTANYTNGMLAAINGTVTDAYNAEGITVANVATRFDMENFEVPEDGEDGLPTNVRNVCRYTWMCDTERGPAVQLNEAGAKEVAALVEEVMRD
ncbi:SGNH/GDSL hydrolase family protein [Thermobifida halotolerans]|uniref:SGNH/GDSL hydrolase family protein n=1 Tax=Thermobifida halotolerans TaxID=483545 RepID=A0A399G2D4_9ACTN|nr:SGNH/GDSL hydrolase family protein [Thermobifida halotolerans]UOE19497.1 SGNH/GDSL hydrolase family protein [Thermobifida halotolerans]